MTSFDHMCIPTKIYRCNSQGDSGGPLLLRRVLPNGSMDPNNDQDDPWFLIGVVSFGTGVRYKRNGRNFGFTIVLNIWRMDRHKENLSGLWARKAWNILKSGGIHSVDSSKHQLKENLTCFSNIFLKFGSFVFCLIIVYIYMYIL